MSYIDPENYVDVSKIVETGQCEITAKNLAALILALRATTEELDEARERLWRLDALR